MRYIYERLKATAFWQKYLVDSAFINFLKRVKHSLERKARLLRNRFFPAAHREDLLGLLSSLLQREPGKLSSKECIDVIVPIYNGYEYLPKLFEGLLRTEMKCRILLVDDKSTDERVHELERSFAEAHDNVALLENEENLGFVKSVNRGLESSQGHVALVNTDVELPSGWLERLMFPILKDEKVASATPFTNSATIYSFPNFCYNNPIYRGFGVDTIDSYFRLLKPQYAEAPTGVGFCMGMSKHAIAEVGILDDETYGRGFGEENDWCQRAIKKGYRNVQVENLFVYHKHGGSFLSEEKERLVQEHLAALHERFPSYDYQVSQFIRKDPNKSRRQLAQLLIDTHELRSVLYFDHDLGGGASTYLDARRDGFLKDGACVSVVRYLVRGGGYRFSFDDGSMQLEYGFKELEDLLEIGKWLHFDEIYLNELVTYPNLWDTLRAILKFAKQQGGKLIMLFHDYFAICPTINLLNTRREYCGMPDAEACEHCYQQKGWSRQYDCESHAKWLNRWQDFLGQCAEVRTFSEDSRKRVADAFGEDLPLTLVPHQVDYLFPIHKETKTTDSLNIGLLGVMAIHKGSGFVQGMLDEIEKQGLDIKVKLIGQTDGVDFKGYKNFEEIGHYEIAQLPRLVYEKDIDIFLVASIWPETFSYTAEEVMKMGLPIVALDMGAPAERVRQYEKGLILEDADPKAALRAIWEFAEEKLRLRETRVSCKKVAFVAERLSFSSRYRMEHMREELLCQGIQGETWRVAAIPKKVDWSSIAALVVYRCQYKEPLISLLAEAKGHGVHVIYEIDDYIFDYQAIKGLAFMADEEYKDFEQYSASIRRCMEACDAYTVSTDHLKAAVQDAFPGKSVFVNRNVASAEMLVLSLQAQHKKRRGPSLLTLGYFSGSHTHGRDFAIISDVLLDFLERHEEACLKIVGCLTLPEGFQKFGDRIQTVDFMDWQKLPEEIASVDINLMPLEDTFFHECKSENKWMEAALVRVPTIGSHTEEIAGVTHPGEDILLCKTEAEWRQGLERLATSEELRHMLAENAFSYVMGHKTTLNKNRELARFVMG